MQRFRHFFVWLKRIGHCRGFGIQSPTDYWLVRYVINEHWPYYQYETLGTDDDWLTQKIGRLYFRIANWLQPKVIESTRYHAWIFASSAPSAAARRRSRSMVSGSSGGTPGASLRSGSMSDE